MTQSFLSGSHILKLYLAHFLTFLARGVSPKWIEAYLRFATDAKVLAVYDLSCRFRRVASGGCVVTVQYSCVSERGIVLPVLLIQR